MSEYPPCPACKSVYAYPDQGNLCCPECGHEWRPGEEAEPLDELLVKDAHGVPLAAGDHVTLIKDLKVKGSSATAKIGTRVRIGRLVEGDHNIDCNVRGIGPMMLKSEFVKKAN